MAIRLFRQQACGESIKVPSHKVINLDIPLVEFAVEEEVDEIVVAVQDRRQSLPLDDLLNCRLAGIDIIDPANFLERETGKLNIAMLSPGWIIFSDGFVQGMLRHSSQRLFDIVISSALLIAASPIMLVAALAIRLESGKGQPILYRQTRVGRNQRVFEILKFPQHAGRCRGDGRTYLGDRGRRSRHAGRRRHAKIQNRRASTAG